MAEKNPKAYRENLLALVSHELYTPITALFNAVTLLEERCPQETEALAMLRRNAERLQQAVDSLMALARAEGGDLQLQLSELSLDNFLRLREHDLRPRLEAENARLELEIEEDLPHVCADARRLGTVFAGLVENALKFADRAQGKELVLKATLALKHADELPARQLNAATLAKTSIFLVITLESSAPSAVALPRDLESLFEPFAAAAAGDTRAREGLGAQLALGREILNAHEGALWAEAPQAEAESPRFAWALPVLSQRDELDLMVGHRLWSPGALEKVSLLLIRPAPGALATAQEQLELDRTVRHLLFRSSDSVLWLADTAELAVVMDDCDARGAERVAERLVGAIRRKMPDLEFFWSVVTGPEDGVRAEELLEKARSSWRPV